MLSIGALSRATGVPVETLRTWERRYGFPAPVTRLESGHRRYPLETVERLRLVVRAIELDHKPSIALRATNETLLDLIALGAGNQPAAARRPSTASRDASFIERCLDHVQHLDGVGFGEELQREWSERGPLEFLATAAGPMLDAVGACWLQGSLEIGHEHFASEHLRDFLSARWRQLSERATGPRVVCATLADERHVLALHMAATVLALGGVQVIFLGGPTPAFAIASLVALRAPEAVVLSASAAADRGVLDREFAALRRATPPELPLVVGGAGFDPPPEGAVHCPTIEGLTALTRTLGKRSA